MAYKIDFTASNYAGRSRRKVFIWIFLAAATVAVTWGVHYVYATYNESTLNMKLKAYESATCHIEEMNAAWDVAEKEWNTMLRYYRLIWAANPTNFLDAVSSVNAPVLGSGFYPTKWTLVTGGKCSLDYRYEFADGDKAQQAGRIAPALENLITSVVEVVDGRIDVTGVQLENLLRLNELNVSACFSLGDVKVFPKKEQALTKCVDEIGAMREKIQNTTIEGLGIAQGESSNAGAIMMKYLPAVNGNPDFPYVTNVIDVAAWFDRADQFIAQNKISMLGDIQYKQRLRNAWNKVGDARFPWDRFRPLDNNELVVRAKALDRVSDKVKQFKRFLDRRHADFRKKIEPLIDGYSHNDVFNKPLVENDLVEQVAKAAGIASAKATFEDDSKSSQAVLAKGKEKYSFTWVHWTLLLGEEAEIRKEKSSRDDGAGNDGGLTLEKLADCVRRALKLGPGYAIDKVDVSFDADGNVSGAVLKGLLPVYKVELAAEGGGANGK